jgi:hypothetical protein
VSHWTRTMILDNGKESEMLFVFIWWQKPWLGTVLKGWWKSYVSSLFNTVHFCEDILLSLLENLYQYVFEAEVCVSKQFGIEYPSDTPAVKAPAFSFKKITQNWNTWKCEGPYLASARIRPPLCTASPRHAYVIKIF